MRFYAGIGSRNTPLDIKYVMARIGRDMEIQGYTLRSGNADGADNAFASEVLTHAQIWLPYEDFNEEYQKMRPNHDYKLLGHDLDAFASVDKFHPNPISLGINGILYMARNYRQIVGKGEPDSEFVICWTKDGKEKGGTAQAMRIAKSLGIPIFNLFDFTYEEIFSKINDLNAIVNTINKLL